MPSVERLLLILLASISCWPLTPLRLTRSLPAKSTKLILLNLWMVAEKVAAVTLLILFIDRKDPRFDVEAFVLSEYEDMSMISCEIYTVNIACDRLLDAFIKVGAIDL